jgi:hypothetical protein
VWLNSGYNGKKNISIKAEPKNSSQIVKKGIYGENYDSYDYYFNLVISVQRALGINRHSIQSGKTSGKK